MLSTDRAGAVMVATPSSPPVNALNDALVASLDAVLDRVAADDGIAVLHIRSSEKAFCAGADLAFTRSCFSAAGGSAAMLKMVERLQRLRARIESLPAVTLAEIGGAALGGGLELALACDIRIAAAKRCMAAQGDPARDGYAEELAATRQLDDRPETRRRISEFLDRPADQRKTKETT